MCCFQKTWQSGLSFFSSECPLRLACSSKKTTQKAKSSTPQQTRLICSFSLYPTKASSTAL